MIRMVAAISEKREAVNRTLDARCWFALAAHIARSCSLEGPSGAGLAFLPFGDGVDLAFGGIAVARRSWLWMDNGW